MPGLSKGLLLLPSQLSLSSVLLIYQLRYVVSILIRVSSCGWLVGCHTSDFDGLGLLEGISGRIDEFLLDEICELRI